MNIKINLLPEARLLRIKDKKKKQYYTLLAVIIIVGVLGILAALLLFYWARLAQKANNQSTIRNLKTDVAAQHELELNATTLQQHLASNTVLNDKRIYVSEIFNQLVKTLPPNVKLTSIRVDEDYNVVIQGTADSLKTVGQFAKALEEFNVNNAILPNLERKALFTSVSVDQVTKQSNSNDVNFTIKFKVDRSLIEKFKVSGKQ